MCGNWNDEILHFMSCVIFLPGLFRIRKIYVMLVTDPGFSPDFYLSHCYVPSNWYESFSRYTSTPEFLSVARETLPLSWDLRQIGVWT